MKCENCNQEHDGSYGSGRFCSQSCARRFSSNIRREETNKKISKSLKGNTKGFCGKSWRSGERGKVPDDLYAKIYKRVCQKCGVHLKRGMILKNGLCSECGDHTNNRRVKIKKSGGYRKGSGRSKGQWFEGLYFDSLFEIEVYKFLKRHGVNVIRNTRRFMFTWENKSTYYIPDFYIVDHDIYLETKGYWWGNKKQRVLSCINQNNLNVMLLYQADWDLDNSKALTILENKDNTYWFENRTK